MPPITLTASEKTAIEELHKNFNSHIKFIADRTYLQKMEATPNSADETNFANRQFKALLDGKKTFTKPQREQGLVRGIHGLRHATRVAIYTDMLHRFRSTKIVGKNGQPDGFPEKAVAQVAKFFNITPENVLMLTKFAAFFHDSAREDEQQDKWDHRSAENCYDFLIQQGVNTEIARFFANAARYKSERENFNAYLSNTLSITNNLEQNNFDYIRQLIAYSDQLDIMRCKSEFGSRGLYNFLRATDNPDNRAQANRLMQEIHQLLAAGSDLPAGGCRIKINKDPAEFLPTISNPTVEWDDKTKLDFEFSADPYSYMQNYINKYINQSPAASLNVTKKSLITDCNWQELFENNQKFVFIATNNQADQVGSLVSKEDPNKHIINIKKDSIEFPTSGDNNSLSADQISATIVILQGLIAQGKYDTSKPLIMEPNNAFTVNMMVTLIERIKKEHVAVAFTANADSSPEMRAVIENYNNEINWHPQAKHKTKP